MSPDYIESARTAMESGNYQEVLRLEKEGRINRPQINVIAGNAFVSLCGKKDFPQAVKLGKTFQIASAKIQEAVQKYFNGLLAESHFDRAVEWGKSNNMPPEDIQEAAVKYCKGCLAKDQIEQALEIMKDFSIPKSALQSAAEETFNRSFQKEEYENALHLADDFEVPENKVLLATTRLLERYVREEKWPKVTQAMENHHFLSESTFEKLMLRDQISVTDMIANKIIRVNLYADNFDFILSFIEKSEVFNSSPKNPQLLELSSYFYTAIVDIHKTLLMRENTAEAIECSEKFKLLDSSVPGDIRESVIAAANKYHTELLKKGDYERAISIKNHYNLYSSEGFSEKLYAWDDPVITFFERALYKAETDKAQNIIRDYNIAKEQARNIVKKVIREKLESKSFPPIFEILKSFPVPLNDNEIVSMAENFLDDAIKENQFELAADIAFYFKLKKKVNRKAAFLAWEKHMQYGRIDEALKLRKRHRLPEDMTAAIAKETYQHFLSNNPEMASRIRNDYQIDLGFLEIVLEILRKTITLLNPRRK